MFGTQILARNLEIFSTKWYCIQCFTNIYIFIYSQGTKLDPGINQRALAELFAETGSRNVDWNYSITVSVIEIYNEMIR